MGVAMTQKTDFMKQVEVLKAFKKGFFGVFSEAEAPMYVNFEPGQLFGYRSKKQGNCLSNYVFIHENTAYVNMDVLMFDCTTEEARKLGMNAAASLSEKRQINGPMKLG